MEREEHQRLVVPTGFYTMCKCCYRELQPGEAVYRIDGYGDVCESCEGKMEPHQHRPSRADWMKYEV